MKSVSREKAEGKRENVDRHEWELPR